MGNGKENNKPPIELRSEEIEEILGKPPRKLVRWGISFIFIVVTVILIGCWFFKYPDVITATVEVTSDNPPAYIKARVNGKIEKIFVQDKQQVDSGDYLMMIENPSRYADVFDLKKDMMAFRPFFRGFDTSAVNTGLFSQNFVLGELQSYFSTFVTKYEDYMHFIILDYNHQKIQSMKEELKMHNMYYDRQYKQKTILDEDVALMEKEYKRYEQLYDSNAVSQSELEKMKSAYLNRQLALEEARTNLANIKIQMSQLEQDILEQRLQYDQKNSELQLALREAYENLLGQIDIWEKDFVLKSPIPGIVTFNKYWKENQNVEEGEEVMAVVPATVSLPIGKLELSTRGAGKVRVGQNVNIKFDNYPYMEFGMVRGVIDRISLVPSDKDFYLVEVTFPDGLKTNYGIHLPFSQKMIGQAEVITDEMPLLVRIIQPLKSLIKNKSFRNVPAPAAAS